MNVRIAQLMNFTAGSWYDGALEMNQYTIKLWMITQTHNPEEQNIAFCRTKYFIYNELDSTIFINSDLKEKCAELAHIGFNITTLPGEPVDQLIGIMLHHKLNAIMENRIALVEVEISAGDAVIYLHAENETSESLQIPQWWASSDVVHSELTTDSNNVVTIQPVTAWRDLDLAWPNDVVESVTTSGNIVSFTDIKSKNDTE
jgi:hypothetical protein